MNIKPIEPMPMALSITSSNPSLINTASGNERQAFNQCLTNLPSTTRGTKNNHLRFHQFEASVAEVNRPLKSATALMNPKTINQSVSIADRETKVTKHADYSDTSDEENQEPMPWKDKAADQFNLALDNVQIGSAGSRQTSSDSRWDSIKKLKAYQ